MMPWARYSSNWCSLSIRAGGLNNYVKNGFISYFVLWGQLLALKESSYLFIVRRIKQLVLLFLGYLFSYGLIIVFPLSFIR
jgi:hypothetical protein